MFKIAIIAFLLLTARIVDADCTYQNGYYDPGFDGACVAETSVPTGCPIHFVTPHAQATAMFTVHRGTQDITLPATTSLVETVGVSLSLVDPVDCDCARTDTTVPFDRQALMLTGAKAGDAVEFASGHLYVPQIVAITAAGPCPALVWPTRFEVATQCDPCPRQPPSSSSCSTGGGGWLAAAITLGLVARRRRPDREPLFGSIERAHVRPGSRPLHRVYFSTLQPLERLVRRLAVLLRDEDAHH